MPMRSSPPNRSATQAVNQHSGGDSGIGMIREVIRSTEDGQRPVAEELIDVPTGFNDGRHHDVKQRVEAGDRVLGGVGLGERGEIANVDEHHCHFAALPGEDIVTLLKQPRRQGRVDVSPERSLKPLSLSQSRLHAVERRSQRAQVVVLNDRQALAVVTGRNTFSAFFEIANGLQGGCETTAPTVIGTPKPIVNAHRDHPKRTGS